MFAGMREEALESGNGLLPMLWVILETSPKVVRRGFWYSVLPDCVFSAAVRLAVSNGFTFFLLRYSGNTKDLILLKWLEYCQGRRGAAKLPLGHGAAVDVPMLEGREIGPVL